MDVINESQTELFKNHETLVKQEEGKMAPAPPENVISSSAGDAVSFGSQSRHDQSDDKRVTNMSSNAKADEKNISHHDTSPQNSSMSEVGVAAKRILEAVPGYTSSDWMLQKYNDLSSVRQPHIDPIQSYSTFVIPPSFEYSTSLSYPYAYRQHLPDTTPPIFQNTPLRRGKWTIVSVYSFGTLKFTNNVHNNRVLI
jgi:hypothetical protein